MSSVHQPEPLIRRVIEPHDDPTGRPCPKRTVVETFTFVPSREIVRVKAVCSRCGWVSLRVVPRER